MKNLQKKFKEDFSVNMTNIRIADLSSKIQKFIKNIKLFEISKPIFSGNTGYAFVKCSITKAKLNEINYKKLKDTELNRYFSILSEKLLKRLKNEANIIIVESIK